jgi:hypothetical protein
MKKFLHFLSAVFVLCALATVLTLSAAAKAEFEMEIPYGTPTVDGVIDEGEYDVTYVMDKTTATAWAGEVGDSCVVWHLAWDEGGLYYAGTINDSTPSWRDANGHWVGIDCLELAINPGRLLKGSKAEGVFFSFGSMKDGSVVGYRHNFADGLVSDAITGVNKGHVEGTDSYTMEVYIPWSLVQIKENCTVGGKESIRLDATKWEATVGAQLGLLPCAIDSLDAHGRDIIAYKFNGTDFIAKDFVVATLANAEGKVPEETEAPTEAPTETPTEAPTEVPTEAPTDTPTEAPTDAPIDAPTDTPADGTEAPAKKGCGSTLAVGLLAVLIPAAWIVLRKRED